MAKYYDEPRRDTSTSTLTDETPKYQKAAQRKKVVNRRGLVIRDAYRGSLYFYHVRSYYGIWRSSY